MPLRDDNPQSSPPSAPVTRDVEVLSTVDAVRALADPARLEMLRLLTRSPQTGSMLARTLGIPANRAHYHLKRLLEADLVQDLGAERSRPTEERYYAARARHLLVDPGLGTAGDRPAQALRRSIDATFADWRRSEVLAIDWSDLARLAVQRSLRIGPADRVMIMFAPITLEAAEAILIEAEAQGASAFLRPWSRNIMLRTLDRHDAVVLRDRPLLPPDLDATITAVVFLSSNFVQGAPPNAAQQEKLPLLLDAVSRWKASARSRGLRYLHIGLPHRGEFTGTAHPPADGDAPDRGLGRDAVPFLGPEDGLDLYWRCLTTDPDAIRRAGSRIEATLRKHPDVRIRHESGADLCVALQSDLLGTNDGIVSGDDLQEGNPIAALPAGSCAAVPVPGSGDGVFEADYTFAGGRHLRGLRLELSAGRIVQLDGPPGTEALRERLAQEAGEPGQLSAVAIGLNPGGRGPTGRPQIDSLLAGTITLEFGNNELLGGTVRSTSNLSFPCRSATLLCGNVELVRRGELLATGEAST